MSMEDFEQVQLGLAGLSSGSKITARLRGPYLSEEVGLRITERTIQAFESRERRTPGIISTAVVIFRQMQTARERAYLRYLEPGQWSRETQYGAADANAYHAQHALLEWLGQDKKHWSDYNKQHHRQSAADCFAECRNFQFSPHRHVQGLSVTNAVVLSATSALIREIQADPRVLAVEEDFSIVAGPESMMIPLGEVHGTVCGEGTRPWDHCEGYTWGWDHLGLRKIHDSGLRGIGIRVGLVNTGVREEHPDLRFKVKDFAKAQIPAGIVPAHAFDNAGHGTFCAGIVVGASNSGTTIGAAPEAELVAVSVIDRDRGYLSSLLRAMQWLCDSYRSISVLNLSIGVPNATEERQRELEEYVDRLMSLNVVCVAANGNERSDVIYPAQLKNVLGCGALEPVFEANGQRTVRVWERSAENPDVVLPGAYVYSCWPPGLPGSLGRDYNWQHGTSCSCGHMSGLLALLMQANREASARMVLAAIVRTASWPEHTAGFDSRWGYGMPDFWHAKRFIDLRTHLMSQLYEVAQPALRTIIDQAVFKGTIDVEDEEDGNWASGGWIYKEALDAVLRRNRLIDAVAAQRPHLRRETIENVVLELVEDDEFSEEQWEAQSEVLVRALSLLDAKNQ
jgi:subtilisin family serine protease